MALIFESLSKSIDALRRALATVGLAEDSLMSDDIQQTLRAGVIQNFEVAYEQSWKMVQRWIRENKTPEDADNPRTRKELFRMAARYGLIEDPIPWFMYGESRNLTSHTYDEEKAISVYQVARSFLGDAEHLLRKLEELND